MKKIELMKMNKRKKKEEIEDSQGDAYFSYGELLSRGKLRRKILKNEELGRSIKNIKIQVVRSDTGGFYDQMMVGMG